MTIIMFSLFCFLCFVFFCFVLFSFGFISFYFCVSFAFAYVFSHNIFIWYFIHGYPFWYFIFISFFRNSIYKYLSVVDGNLFISLIFFYNSPIICANLQWNSIWIQFKNYYYPLRCKITEQTSNMADCVISRYIILAQSAVHNYYVRQPQKSWKIAQFNSQATQKCRWSSPSSFSQSDIHTHMHMHRCICVCMLHTIHCVYVYKKMSLHLAQIC